MSKKRAKKKIDRMDIIRGSRGVVRPKMMKPLVEKDRKKEENKKLCRKWKTEQK